jgi:hypothetical protein
VLRSEEWLAIFSDDWLVTEGRRLRLYRSFATMRFYMYYETM